MTEIAPEDTLESLIGQQVSDLLIREGTSKRKLTAAVSDILQIGARSARRKLYGTADFSTKELTTLLDHFGYEYRGLLGIRKKDVRQGLDDADTIEGQRCVKATLDFEGVPRECRIWIREDARGAPAAKAKVVIKHESGAYQLIATEDVPAGATAMMVDRIEVEKPFEYEGSGAYVAVFDEDKSVADAVAEGLRKAGFKTKAISSQEELTNCLQTERFEAFLLNWEHWNKWKPIELGLRVRESFEDASIVFSAGFDDGDRPELIQAAEACDAMLMVHPATTQLITRNILRDLKLKRSRSV